MITLKVCQFTFLNVPHVLHHNKAGTVFLIGQLICSLRELMAFYPPVPCLRCKPANPLCTREGCEVLALPRMSRRNGLLTKWDSRFSVRPANTAIAHFDFIGSATDLKNIILLILVWFQVQDVNGYLFHHYPVHLCLLLFWSVI